MSHLNLGVQLASTKPMVFVPALLGSLVSIFISILTFSFDWQVWGGWLGVSLLFSLVGFIVSYILYFASIDMSRDAYFNSPLNLMESINYVLRRVGTLIVASIVGAIMSITIILIPAALLMFVIMVVDESGIGDSLSKAFSVLTRELGDILILIIISILGSIVLGFIPYIGSLLQAGLRVVIGLAFIDLYYQYKNQRRLL